MQDAEKTAVLVSRLFGGEWPHGHSYYRDCFDENVCSTCDRRQADILEDPAEPDECQQAFNPFLSVADAFLCVEKLTKSMNEIEPGKGDFMFDGLGYRCCDADEDGLHGRWRAWFVREDQERKETFVTADTPARAIAEACYLAVKGDEA